MNSKKILNFVLDEKFIDYMIMTHDLFSEYDHEYIYVSNTKPNNFKLIKKTDRINVIPINKIKNIFKRTDIGGIFLHSLYSYPIKLIPQIPSNIKVFWFSWGYDIYERPLANALIKLPLYRTLTKRELSKPQYIPLKVKRVASRFIKRIMRNGLLEKKTYLKAVDRINFFSGILPIEYDIVKENTNFKAKRVNYKYLFPNPKVYGEKKQYKGNNILIGNSANPTNNHLDIINKLKEFKLNNREIVVPLSYGGSAQYINSVNNYGKQHFGNNWNSLRTIIEYNKYQEIISSCNVGIFLLERQQGMGNINMMLQRGCKVFLSETSVIYKYLLSIGIKVFSFETEFTQENLDTPLTEEEKDRNRKISLESCTFDATKKRFDDIYALI